MRGPLLLDVVYVAQEVVYVGFNAKKHLRVFIAASELQEIFQQVVMGCVYAGGYGRKVLEGVGAREPGRGVCEGSRALGDLERGREFRHSVLVYAALCLSQVVEGKPSHQCRGEGQGHSAAQCKIKLGGHQVS